MGNPQVIADAKGIIQLRGESAKIASSRESPNRIMLAGSAGEFPSLGGTVDQSWSSLGTSIADGKWASKATTTSLSIRDFEGVRAEGKSTNYTIPAGEIGNKNAITVTTESWYSSELQATVYLQSTQTPRSGETVYRMTNIKRGEPSAARSPCRMVTRSRNTDSITASGQRTRARRG